MDVVTDDIKKIMMDNMDLSSLGNFLNVFPNLKKLYLDHIIKYSTFPHKLAFYLLKVLADAINESMSSSCTYKETHYVFMKNNIPQKYLIVFTNFTEKPTKSKIHLINSVCIFEDLSPEKEEYLYGFLEYDHYYIEKNKHLVKCLIDHFTKKLPENRPKTAYYFQTEPDDNDILNNFEKDNIFERISEHMFAESDLFEDFTIKKVQNENLNIGNILLESLVYPDEDEGGYKAEYVEIRDEILNMINKVPDNIPEGYIITDVNTEFDPLYLRFMATLRGGEITKYKQLFYKYVKNM